MIYTIMNKVEELVWTMVMKRHSGSAIIGEVLIMIVVVAMAALFKIGGLAFINQIWEIVTENAEQLFSHT